VIKHGGVLQSPTIITSTGKHLFSFTSTVDNGNAIMFPRNTTCRVLVLAGGGSGGVFHAGGGGAGALIHIDTLQFIKSVEYTINVGIGGPKVPSGARTPGNNGGDSWIKSSTSVEYVVLAKGGGGGSGIPGGSGGGGQSGEGVGVSGIAVTTNVPANVYGNTGGRGSYLTFGWLAQCFSGAGGGGAGSQGQDATNCVNSAGKSICGKGGSGIANDITGQLKPYAAGGSGGPGYGTHNPAAGGSVLIGSTTVIIGGAGVWNNQNGNDGVANTGSGGSAVDILRTSGAGSDGIVILQWDCCLSCSQPTQCPTNSTARCTSFNTNICCGPGTYFVGGIHTECQTCPTGTYSYDGSDTACTDCAIGTYSSSSQTQTCKKCEAGTYTSTTKSISCQPCKTCTMDAQLQFTECAAGSTSDTVVCVCMAGFYNLTSTCARCPPNTISAVSNRSTTILNCRCIAGYVCTYTKRLSVKVRLYNTTLAGFDIKQRLFLISAMASAAGVSTSSVSILNVNNIQQRRRNLLSST
jgi:hypothetical protein